MNETIGTVRVAQPLGWARKERPWFLDVWVRLVRTKPLATAGLVVALIFVLVGVFSDLIAPEGVNDAHVDRLEVVPGSYSATGETYKIPGPSWEHPFGLDQIGRDVLSRMIHGTRVSVIVALGVVVVAVGGGALVGVVSAWLGGKFDMIVQRIVDGWLTLPPLPVLITIVVLIPEESPLGILGSYSWAMIKIILALGVLAVAWYSRIVRSAALVAKEQQYVDAARAIGASGRRIVFNHILPNVMAPITVIGTTAMAYAILTEAALSFLGYGVPSPQTSWGGLLTQGGVLILFRAPWLAFYPGMAIVIVVMALNLLGDGLRDVLDPRLRGTSR